MSVTLRGNSNQFRFGYAEADYDMKNIFSVNTRYEYDFNFEQTSRFEMFGTYKQLKNINLKLYYNYRQPQIRYNSIFSVFDFGNTQEIEGGVDYTLNKKYLTLSGKFGFVDYRDDNSQRVSLGVISPLGTVDVQEKSWIFR
jgi:lipopolysaccharide assembly outer membrane protein LptD (OstA)